MSTGPRLQQHWGKEQVVVEFVDECWTNSSVNSLASSSSRWNTDLLLLGEVTNDKGLDTEQNHAQLSGLTLQQELEERKWKKNWDYLRDERIKSSNAYKYLNVADTKSY